MLDEGVISKFCSIQLYSYYTLSKKQLISRQSLDSFSLNSEYYFYIVYRFVDMIYTLCAAITSKSSTIFNGSNNSTSRSSLLHTITKDHVANLMVYICYTQDILNASLFKQATWAWPIFLSRYIYYIIRFMVIEQSLILHCDKFCGLATAMQQHIDNRCTSKIKLC